MGSIFRVRWTIVPRLSPRLWRTCATCGGPKPFHSSGKIRLNANGKKLDAWLIYKCSTCGATWNRTVFERQNVHGIDQAVLEALHTNDAGFVRRLEFDTDALRRKGLRVEERAEVDVQKCALSDGDSGWTALHIELAVPLPTCLRLDRLLAAELKIPRSQLLALHEKGKLRINPNHKNMLRHRLKNAFRILLDLTESTRLQDVWKIAAGR